MLTIYIDEKIEGDFYLLGVLVILDEVWSQRFIGELLEFRPPLSFHASEDREVSKSRTQQLSTFVQSHLIAAGSGHLEWNFIRRRSEKDAWKALVDWAYAKYKPRPGAPLQVFRDRGNLRKETSGMLTGNTLFKIQAVPKVQSSESRPQPQKILIGVVDYMLYFNIFRELAKKEGRKL